MTPDTSVPGTWPTRPPAAFQSTGLTPAARTLMSTSPAPGFGTGISRTESVPPSPTCTPCILSGAAHATAPKPRASAAIPEIARMSTPEYSPAAIVTHGANHHPPDRRLEDRPRHRDHRRRVLRGQRRHPPAAPAHHHAVIYEPRGERGRRRDHAQ